MSKVNIIILAVVNLLLFMLVTTGFEINNAIASNGNFSDYTYMDSLISNITSRADSYTINMSNTSASLYMSDTLREPRKEDQFDDFEGVVGLTKGVFKITGLLFQAQFPAVALYQYFVASSTTHVVRSIGLLFITVWQLASLTLWLKFIFGSRLGI